MAAKESDLLKEQKEKDRRAKGRRDLRPDGDFCSLRFQQISLGGLCVVSYQTAYLKTHYPVEFMAGLMTSEMGDTDKVIKNLSECREKRLKSWLRISTKAGRISPVGDKIRFGLAAVKNVGEKAVEVILESRAKEGAFDSLFDFCRRVDLTAVNRRVIESLIKCGAFDSTQLSRARMLAALDEAIRVGQAFQRDSQSNQIDIFGLLGGDNKAAKKPGHIYPEVEEWSVQQSLAFEKEALGFYITGHWTNTTE